MTHKYVYVIWDHTEGGPDSHRATLIRELVPKMLDAELAKYRSVTQDDRSEYHAYLAEYLSHTDEHLAGNPEEDPPKWRLYRTGWGGLHLQVLGLFA